MSQPGDSPRRREEEEEEAERQQHLHGDGEEQQADEQQEEAEEGEQQPAEGEGAAEEEMVEEQADAAEGDAEAQEDGQYAEADDGGEPQAEEEEEEAEQAADAEDPVEHDEADAPAEEEVEIDAEADPEQEQHAEDAEAEIGYAQEAIAEEEEEEDHGEGQPSPQRDGEEYVEQPEGVEGEAPAEADLDAAAGGDEQEQHAEAEADAEPAADAAEEQAQETGDSSFVNMETSGEQKEQDIAETSGHTGETSGNTGDAAPAADADAAPAPEVEAEQPAPDFSHLSGRELAKAQALWAHTQRMAALERRLAEEEAQDQLETAAFHEERVRYLEEADQQFDDDAELLGSVQPLPPDEDALAETYAAVEQARREARQTIVPALPSLDEDAADALVLDAIDLEEVRGAEAAVETARVARLKEEAAGFLARIEALKRRDADAKSRSDALHAALLADISKRRELLGSSSTQWQEQQDRAFVKAQQYLSAALETQKKTIKREYGELQEVKPIYCDGRVREPPQHSAPRIMTLKVDCLRAVKNKLPGGFYVVLVTLYDRLGGHPLRWCKLPDGSGIGHSAMTSAPQRHGGKFYNLELSFQQEANLLTLCCPSLAQARPNNVLLFELVSVRGGKNLSDRVLAWGAFPLMHTDRSLIRGRFKVPLLRGEANLRLDKFSQLQSRLAENIDYWMCNLYFEAGAVPLRANFGWAGLRIRSLQYKIDAHAMAKGSALFKGGAGGAGAGVGAGSGGGAGGGNPYGRLGGGPGAGNDGGADDDSTGKGGGSGNPSGGGGGGGGGPVRLSTPNLPSAGGLGRDVNPFMQSKFSRTGASAGQPPKKGMLGFGSMGGGGGGGGGMGLGLGLGMGGGGKNNSPTQDEFLLPSSLQAGLLTEQSRALAARERAKELRQYKHSITTPESDIPLHKSLSKSRFIRAELTADLGFGRATTLEFWSLLIMFALAFWLRIYVHYFGQYLWIRSSWRNAHAVFRFEVEATRCILEYQLDPLEAVVTQGLVVAVGVVSNQIALLALMLLCWLSLRVVGTFSDACFRFLLVYGLNVLLDPLLITLVDLCHANWDGDYFKLYNAYETSRGQGGDIGYAGAFLTLALAAVLCAVSLVILFVYITRLHMDGRMLDVFQRLQADEGAFFVPNDLELSVRTLRYILAKSNKWTGFHGTRRKVLLTAYLIDDHMDRSFHERTLHLSIYNVTPRYGKRPEQRDIFRHFVRTSDGAIIEAFEACDSLGADGYQKLEERWLSQEATSVDEKEAEAEDLLKAMLSDQKRADAQVAGSRAARGIGAAGAASSTAAGGASPTGAGGTGGVASSVPAHIGARSNVLPISPAFGPSPTSPSPDMESLSAHGGRGMSVVQELSERSDFDDNDPAAAPERDAQLLDQIGEEHSEIDEEEEDNE